MKADGDRLAIVVGTRVVPEGEGAVALRLLGEGLHLDPFVLFDDYTIPPLAYFPMHPHSGFEGFQFLSQGSTLYQDNLGNEGTIGPGGARRFLCTGDFEHSERPVGGWIVRGFLLWVKVPQEKRSTTSVYVQSSGTEMPLRTENGLRVRTVAGRGSPLGSTVPFSMDVLEGGGQIGVFLDRDENAFVYVRDGSASLDGTEVQRGQGCLFRGGSMNRLIVADGSIIVLARGKRTNESIVQDGNKVL